MYVVLYPQFAICQMMVTMVTVEESKDALGHFIRVCKEIEFVERRCFQN